MPKNLKHLKYFTNYIAEQEMPAEEGAAVAAPKEPKFSFIFIESDDEGDYTYPDGSSSRRYNTYEIKKPELEKWIDANIVVDEDKGMTKSAVDVKRKAMFEFISGIKSSLTPDDKQYIEKFKNAITTGMEGRQIQDTDVIFSPKDKRPTTDSVDVTFITIPKK